jgi:peptide/nickel transport system ATP-binding protein
MTKSDILLDVQDLKVSFKTEDGDVHAVDGVSFQVKKGQTLGIVGESGCGKSVTSLAIMRLIPTPPGWIRGGNIFYKGQDLMKIPMDQMRKIRGNEISMIFQEPMTSLNPVFTIGQQVTEAVLLHEDLSPSAAKDKAIEMLRMVGIPAPEKRISDYPHQLSGGMRQRVMIAMALGLNPQVLIADEPTTALDVTIQAQVLDLLRDLQQKVGMALILITHDLGVVAEMADEVLVMYAGKTAEFGSVREIFKNPSHPYTRGLLNSIPTLNQDPTGKIKKTRLEAIPGIVPNLLDLPQGCRFQERCKFVSDICKQAEPELKAVKGRSAGSLHEFRCVKEGF